ncbi:MAG: hypothetical protein RQ722_09385 [Desulfuromonadales bacterium]|nr:hypothetical protein [Desulfuromonadales bacterium]
MKKGISHGFSSGGRIQSHARTELQVRDTWGKFHQMIVHKAPLMDQAYRPASSEFSVVTAT